MTELFIIVGPPKDKARQLAIGITSLVPPPGSTEENCERCCCVVLLGPKQSQYAQVNPATPILCLACGAWLNSHADEVKLQHLGGQSSRVDFDLSRIKNHKN